MVIKGTKGAKDNRIGLKIMEGLRKVRREGNIFLFESRNRLHSSRIRMSFINQIKSKLDH
jgi:hypothetical protein